MTRRHRPQPIRIRRDDPARKPYRGDKDALVTYEEVDFRFEARRDILREIARDGAVIGHLS